MSKSFRPYDIDQDFMFPPTLRDWLPSGHLAHFVSDLVDEIDLSALLAVYERGDGRGAPPYHPLMMTKLIVYGYCTGIYSSRRIETATYEQIAYRFLSCDQHPDHDSIAEFRRRHLLGDELPAELERRESRLKRIREVAVGERIRESPRISANGLLNTAKWGFRCRK
jgi:transposase